MLISGELYDALRDGGTDADKAQAAAALIATQELRLRRLETILTWMLRWAVIGGASVLATVLMVLVVR